LIDTRMSDIHRRTWIQAFCSKWVSFRIHDVQFLHLTTSNCQVVYYEYSLEITNWPVFQQWPCLIFHPLL
jgi:hypothetical protein